MMVVCIDNSCGNSRHFELGKIYKAERIEHLYGSKSDKYYSISEKPWTSLKTLSKRIDNEMNIWVNVKCFIPLDEWRRLKIDEVLNLSKLEGNLD